MQKCPIEVGHYKFRLLDDPTLKMKKIKKDGKVIGEEAAAGPNGEALYEVRLYARSRQKIMFGEKDSEEMKVTLPVPCEDVQEDDLVELVGLTMSTYSFTTANGKVSGVSYEAEAVVKVG